MKVDSVQVHHQYEYAEAGCDEAGRGCLAIPAYLFNLGNIAITKDVLLMVVFALLMFAASITMIRKDDSLSFEDGNHPASLPEQSEGPRHEFDAHEPNLFLVLPGLLIGLITGLLGAGGGFLIIPTLVLIIRMPMKIAVGTSLLIVAINSLFGFLFSLKHQPLNWLLMLLFTGLAIIGIIIGSKLSDKIPSETLKKAFGWFILTMGIYILIRELWL